MVSACATFSLDIGGSPVLIRGNRTGCANSLYRIHAPDFTKTCCKLSVVAFDDADPSKIWSRVRPRCRFNSACSSAIVSASKRLDRRGPSPTHIFALERVCF